MCNLLYYNRWPVSNSDDRINTAVLEQENLVVILTSAEGSSDRIHTLASGVSLKRCKGRV